MEDKYIIASNLTNYRKQAGFSQLDLAKKLNYSNKNISKWENGETTPNIFVLKNIADVYGIKVDDLLTEKSDLAEYGQEMKNKQASRRKKIFKATFLFLAIAILFTVASIAIYVLTLTNVTGFNKWLIYLYILPLSFLCVYIFIRVEKKLIDIVSLSLIGWSICLCIYLSFISMENIEYIFLVGFAYQLIAICVAVLVNFKLWSKMTNKLKNLKTNKEKKELENK